MFYHLKIAIRTFRRNGIYSGINIAGMAISLAACILIMLWVWDELSFDRFHRNADRIYCIILHVDKMAIPASPSPLGDAIMGEIPSVEMSCRIGFFSGIDFLEYEGEKFYELSATYADASYFTMFDFKLLSGNVDHLSPDAVVISQSVARRIFGDKDPVGEMLKGSGDRSYYVAGVMENIPANSSIQFDVLLPYPDTKDNENWGNIECTDYLLVHNGSNIAALGEDITALYKRKHPFVAQMANFKVTLQNIKQQHLYQPDGTEGGIQSVRLFFIIGILILVIAGINYVNLITARASKRSREIGLRKVVGASKINLLGQLMQEAVILFAAAIALALVIVWCALPLYNTLTAKTFDIVSFLPRILAICAGAFLAVSLLAGLYPAFMLASFQPSEAFKNKSGQGKNAWFRKILVIVQFVFSAGLIMGTIVISLQMKYIQNMNPGYNRENVVMIPQGNMDLDLVRGELLELPGIAGISAANGEICNIGRMSDANWEGKDPNEIFMMNHINVESHFISTMGLKLVEGLDFTGTEADKDGFIINETAVRLIGFDEPIGKHIEFMGIQGVVIGVVNDFNFTDMHREIGPVSLYCYQSKDRNLLYARIEQGKTRIALDNIEKVWKRYNADSPFTYTFVDETFDKMHRSDMRTGTLFTLFAVIAVMISCLGLFGLVTFTAETKTKEIGIRKVLGANVMSIIKMLSREFLILVGIAMLIAFPLAYWLLSRMLEDFAYRIAIRWWMFAAAAVIVALLTLLTVGWQAIKAATANPIKAIKSE